VINARPSLSATTRAARAVAIGLTIGCASLLSGCSMPPRSAEAAWLLADLAAGDSPTRLQRRHPWVERQAHVVPADAGAPATVADSYRSENRRRGVLVLVHGFSEHGRRDPRLVQFARALARSGFLVFVPELPGLRDLSISTREVVALRAAISHALDAFPEAHHQPTGALALSLAVGPLLMAAKAPELRDRVSFLVAVGGYYDLADAVRFITTGVDAGDDAGITRTPVEAGRWVVLASQSHWLEDAAQQALLARLAQRRIDNPDAAVDDLLAQLDADGQALFTLTDNRNPDAVDHLLQALPAAAQAEFRALDLAQRDLSAIRARVVLIHGRDDAVIPISHSRRLSASLDGAPSVWLHETTALGHVEVRPSLIEGFTLWRAARRILQLGETRHP